MKPTTILASLILITVLTVGAAQAQGESEPLQRKSVGVITLLALDPIPGDALFYAGKNGQAAVNSALGGFGGFLFWYGAINQLTHKNQGCTGSDMSSCDPSPMINTLLMVGGGILYFPALLWDAIGGIHGVAKHNKKVQAQETALWRRIRPNVAVTGEGFFASVEWNF